jgi:hypothetical protein
VVASHSQTIASGGSSSLARWVSVSIESALSPNTASAWASSDSSSIVLIGKISWEMSIGF